MCWGAPVAKGRPGLDKVGSWVQAVEVAAQWKGAAAGGKSQGWVELGWTGGPGVPFARGRTRESKGWAVGGLMQTGQARRPDRVGGRTREGACRTRWVQEGRSARAAETNGGNGGQAADQETNWAVLAG